MKYIKNYADQAAYDADLTRPTDSSVVSSIEKVGVKYEGKNVFVPKESADVGDIVVLSNGTLKYIKLDTYDAALITVETIGVVYHRTPNEIRIVYKGNSGSARWAAPTRVKVEGFDLVNGGTHTITVNSTAYVFTFAAGATLVDVATAIVAALLSGVGWSATAGVGYVVIQRSGNDLAISTFSISGLTVTILNVDNQVQSTGFLAANLSIARKNGFSHTYGGGNFAKFLSYYENSGSEATGVGPNIAEVVRRSVFNEVNNPLLTAAYDTYEDYIMDNMVKYPYSKDAIVDSNGRMNTDLLSAGKFTDDDNVEKPKFPAADSAKEVVGGGLDWWLPSAEELFLLMSKVGDTDDPINRSLAAIGSVVSNGVNYWSSSERGTERSWCYYELLGFMYGSVKNYSYYVRAVSAFLLS